MFKENNTNNSKRKRIHITTFDNPFNPFEDFASWFDYDMEKGYCSCERVARLTNVTDDMTDLEKEMETEKATKRLVEIDPLNLYQIISTFDDQND